jgi:oxygen-independent coproporphyrinogen III oxidase
MRPVSKRRTEKFNVMKSGAPNNSDAFRHIYVHFPFCARICPYCAFYKTRGSTAEVAQFCHALQLEAENSSKKFSFALETIFFGGGTPTALSTTQLGKLLQAFRDLFDLSALREWSNEANPGSVSRGKAETLRHSGISRISLGVQSWDDDLLRLLGREHNAAQAEESFRIFRASGFENISVDLMFALPGQREEQWRASLKKTIALEPEHISTYCLTFEEDTDFFSRLQRGEFRAHDDTEARFFEIAINLLESAGYEHYEISNFARPGFRSRHNQAYWHGADYLGLGPSAWSTRGFQRWQNVADHREYARRLSGGESPVASIEKLTGAMKRTERIALGLRTSNGIPANLVANDRVRHLIDAGLLVEMENRFFLSGAGKLLADSVAEELL